MYFGRRYIQVMIVFRYCVLSPSPINRPKPAPSYCYFASCSRVLVRTIAIPAADEDNTRVCTIAKVKRSFYSRKSKTASKECVSSIASSIVCTQILFHFQVNISTMVDYKMRPVLFLEKLNGMDTNISHRISSTTFTKEKKRKALKDPTRIEKRLFCVPKL